MPQASAEADVLSQSVLQSKANAPLVMSHALSQMLYTMCHMLVCYHVFSFYV